MESFFCVLVLFCFITNSLNFFVYWLCHCYSFKRWINSTIKVPRLGLKTYRPLSTLGLFCERFYYSKLKHLIQSSRLHLWSFCDFSIITHTIYVKDADGKRGFYASMKILPYPVSHFRHPSIHYAYCWNFLFYHDSHGSCQKEKRRRRQKASLMICWGTSWFHMVGYQNWSIGRFRENL